MLDSVFTFSLINTLMFLLFTRKKYANHEFRVKHLKYVMWRIAVVAMNSTLRFYFKNSQFDSFSRYSKLFYFYPGFLHLEVLVGIVDSAACMKFHL